MKETYICDGIRFKTYDEVLEYLEMLNKQGYGHDISDQRKRVNAGVIIAKHIHKKAINNFDMLMDIIEDLVNGSSDISHLRKEARELLDAINQ